VEKKFGIIKHCLWKHVLLVPVVMPWPSVQHLWWVAPPMPGGWVESVHMLLRTPMVVQTVPLLTMQTTVNANVHPMWWFIWVQDAGW
jgi:hypothetical protein